MVGFYGVHVGKFTVRPMDAMGKVFFFSDCTMVNLFMMPWLGIPGDDENAFSWKI